MRVEFGPDVGVTIVTPGLIESEITQGKFIGKAGNIEIDPDMRDVSTTSSFVLDLSFVVLNERGMYDKKKLIVSISWWNRLKLV